MKARDAAGAPKHQRGVPPTTTPPVVGPRRRTRTMPHAADLDYGDELPIIGSTGVGFHGYPDDLLTDDEAAEWKRELDERAQRRRPPGFTAVWPEGPPKRVPPKRRRRTSTERKGK